MYGTIECVEYVLLTLQTRGNEFEEDWLLASCIQEVYIRGGNTPPRIDDLSLSNLEKEVKVLRCMLRAL